MPNTIEENAFVAALDDNDEGLHDELRKLLPAELRQIIYAAFNLAEVGQEIERERAE